MRNDAYGNDCVFNRSHAVSVDLQPLWANHPEYTAADGIQASPAGATVIADAIWATMQDNCIEQ